MKQLLTLSIILCTIACSSGKPKVASSPDEQCIATTQKGTRCQLEVEGNSSYCPLHNPEYDKCQATTKAGSLAAGMRKEAAAITGNINRLG